MFECQMWRNSHFTPMSNALKRERQVGGHKWEIWWRQSDGGAVALTQVARGYTAKVAQG